MLLLIRIDVQTADTLIKLLKMGRYVPLEGWQKGKPKQDQSRRLRGKTLGYLFIYFFNLVSENRKRHRLDNDGKRVVSYHYLDKVEERKQPSDLLPEGNL